MKKGIYIFIVLCSVMFFELVFLPEFVLRIVRLLGVIVMALFLIIYLVYEKKGPGRMRFALPVILIFVSVLISMFAAYAFHNQSFLATAIAQQAIYYYLVYFLLHYFGIPIGFVKKTFVVFAIVYIVLYFAQHALYPIELLQSKMFMDRGTLRIALPGAGFLVISYFIWLHDAFKSFRFSTIVLLLMAYGVFILLATRQVIGAILLLTILFILQSKVVKSRILFFALIGLSIIPVYLIFEEILINMFELTVSQSQRIDSYIRVRAARFFLTDFYPNVLAYFTGNGASGSSDFGTKILYYAQRYGYYQVDLGLIGEYTEFGALFVIGVIMIFFRVFQARLPEDLMFIKYNFLGILLTLVVGGGAFGTSSGNILINCTLLYVMDTHLNQAGVKAREKPGDKTVDKSHLEKAVNHR